MWWYARMDERVGPVDTDALKTCLQAGVIDADSLVWKEGFAEWAPIRDVDELTPLLRSVPPPLPGPAAQSVRPAPVAMSDIDEAALPPASGATRERESTAGATTPAADVTAPRTGRWRRYWARMFDIWWESILVTGVLLAVLVAWSPAGGKVPGDYLSPYVLGVAVLPLALLLDVAVFGVFGNTPGKALLGLHVTDEQGSALRTGQYFGRNVGVWMSGLCLGLPLASFFSLVYQAHNVGKTGHTSYDEATGYQVLRARTGVFKPALFVFLAGCVIVVAGILAAVGKELLAAGPESTAQRAGHRRPASDVASARSSSRTAAVDDTSATGDTRCDSLFVGARTPTFVNAKLETRTTYLCWTGFAVMYSGVTRTPLWSAEHVTAAGLASSPPDVETRQHAADQLPASDRTGASDFEGSRYQAVPMTPPADLATATARYGAGSYANAAPIYDGPALEYWRNLGAGIRREASRRGDLYVISGTLFKGNDLQSLGGRVLVPTAFYKAIYDLRTASGAVYMVDNTAEAHTTVISLAELEKRAGMDLFPGVPPSVKRVVGTFK